MGAAHATTAELKQQVFARYRKNSRTRNTIKSTTIAAYTGVFLLVISLVAIGYQPPQKVDSVANAVETPVVSTPSTPQPSVDQLVATNVAAGIAERAELPVATNIANLSVSLSAESQLAQNDANVISKPQIIQPSASGRQVRQYTVKAGDTAVSIAMQFGLSPNTVKWANNLTGDAVEPGRQLAIPPVDGVVYTVKAGDTIDSIVSKYNADKERVVAFNDLEIDGLIPGKQIVIPAGSLPENERPGYVAPRSYGGYGSSYSVVDARLAGASAGNRYAFGNCTWYAYERRMQLGRPVGSFWGNAATWAAYARAAGYLVNNTPVVGAVMQNGGGYGHVAVVESVNADGSITISEMNYAGNFNRVTSRTVDAGSVGGFNYIH